MALPNQLKSARMTDSTVGANIDDNVGDLEQAICDIFGITIDTNVTETPLDLDNSGRITKQLLRLAAAAPMGIRFRDTTNSKEFRLALNNSSITLDENTGSEGTPTWTNRLTIALGTGLPTLAAATDPTDAKDLTRKGYVDGLDTANVKKSGAQSIDGVKTFTSIPVGPASDPTTDNQLARKAYVDGITDTPLVILQHTETSGTHAGGQNAGSWVTRKLNTESVDSDNICTLSSNEFTLPAGTYELTSIAPYWSIGYAQTRLYNVSDTAVEVYGGCVMPISGTYHVFTHSTIYHRFTLASTKTLRIESRTNGSNTLNGWGSACGFGGGEVYLQVMIKKVA